MNDNAGKKIFLKAQMIFSWKSLAINSVFSKKKDYVFLSRLQKYPKVRRNFIPILWTN